jgi:3-deoxy-D-manno-octulosonate 8-phosphate phosphatase (KDO 8-P phosphatase)
MRTTFEMRLARMGEDNVSSSKINIVDIHLIVYDFDGVMTDNKVLVFHDGTEAVWCNRADGLAISEIKKIGIPQIIISTETNSVVQARAQKIELPVLQGINDKADALIRYCQEHSVNTHNVLYVGNDINDVGAMKIVGYSIAPANSADEVKNIATLVVKKDGGDGVIREILDYLILS